MANKNYPGYAEAGSRPFAVPVCNDPHLSVDPDGDHDNDMDGGHSEENETHHEMTTGMGKGMRGE